MITDQYLDQNLLLLLTGVLLYKLIDLLTCWKKIKQSMLRISRKKVELPPTFFHRFMSSLNHDFLLYFMGLIFFGLLVIGFATLALKGQRNSDFDKMVVAFFTIVVSVVVSAISAAIESFRLRLEEAQI